MINTSPNQSNHPLNRISPNLPKTPYSRMTSELADSLDDATIDAIELQLLESASSALTDDCDIT